MFSIYTQHHKVRKQKSKGFCSHYTGETHAYTTPSVPPDDGTLDIDVGFFSHLDDAIAYLASHGYTDLSHIRANVGEYDHAFSSREKWSIDKLGRGRYAVTENNGGIA